MSDAQFRDRPPQTVMQALDAAAKNYADAPALRAKVGGGIWKDTSWAEYHASVRRAAKGLIALGLEPGRGVTLIGFNCKEWLIGDIAAIYAGGIPVGIYATNSPEQCQYVAGHCDANIAIVENEEQLAKFLAIRDQLPLLKAIVLISGEHDDEAVHSWASMLAKGDALEDGEAALEARIAAQKPEDICTLIYTSGTTGDPKGVMLSHDNLTWTAASASSVIELTDGATMFSYLPLSHIAEQIISIYIPIQLGLCTAFAESFDKMPQNLSEVRPQVFLGVPRVWEKIQAKMMAAGAQNSGLKKAIAKWARKVGQKAMDARQRGEAPPLTYGLADKLVFSKVKQRLGLDNSILNVTSAAPIAKETLDFFASLGVLINEVYGMSECSGPATMSTPNKFRIGWIGWQLPGAEVKVAEDGELCMRGRNVFKGYYKNPEATAETLDDEGWLHSGDIGEKSGEFFRITDRKKDLLITAGGENIAPQLIEGKLKNIVWISQAVVVGDRKPFLSALVTIDEDKFAELVAETGSSAKTTADLVDDDKVRAFLMESVQEVNAGLARVQTIKKIRVLPADLSIDGGELTPTMKVKRKIVRQKYEVEIESFYQN
ncbi:Long-chain-fatty-acid--CoA ligase FadD15 [Enhygromyxa salina]|uniref:Long-chain-fatty-acid--CoA ligase FadD15 n=1 Tax=Enhygromyxa salina TaxID=215803 RepID=A0A2S9XXG7_9BACT|nr:AMP-binding protein [Enhygromyxa salina]PRP97534.1 Long-chain-fatty-acid--CoA ligase FadD15 [Enhygromyxa salina]